MLSHLDETLRHQVAATFCEVGPSDHRFFDRLWFCAYHPEGDVALITGMGCYTNMNVLDGFAAVSHRGRQHNLRLSRCLRPRIDDLAVGPLRVEVLEPLRALRLVLDGDAPGGTAFDLHWEGALPPTEEAHHLDVLDGRRVSDYRRFDQVGAVRGTLRVEGETFDAAGWFGARDHSWGVRRGVGGFEPFTGSLPPEAAGYLFLWLAFTTDEVGGQLQLHEDGEGRRRMLDGALTRLDRPGEPVRVVDVAHELDFVPGTRAYRHARLRIDTEDGGSHVLEAEPLVTAWAYLGTGYDGGFDDGRGLGAFRGDLVVEHDVYDVSHPEDVGLPDGRVVRPVHREQPVRLTFDGRPGLGHLPVINVGRIRRYGLGEG
ncbi:MAG: hypothetical protein M5U14_09545 [Acidimicrobiia bacterium]|nr:hypothetical protein [Acidimicrobiia bacterium]